MNNALTIAAVTHILKVLLNSGINEDISGALEGDILVSALPPDRIKANDGNRLNIFMYRVTPYAGMKNLGFPSPVSPGKRTSIPPLTIDTHYLLTAFGKSELQSEILLGYGMKVLHEYPFLGQDYIRKSLTPRSLTSSSLSDPVISALSNNELANQMEQIKIIPENLSLENISGLWTAFQSIYRPSASYLVSVV